MEKKMVYRVWYGKKLEKEAFFTEEVEAEDFARLIKGAVMNHYRWEMNIEG